MSRGINAAAWLTPEEVQALTLLVGVSTEERMLLVEYVCGTCGSRERLPEAKVARCSRCGRDATLVDIHGNAIVGEHTSECPVWVGDGECLCLFKGTGAKRMEEE